VHRFLVLLLALPLLSNASGPLLITEDCVITPTIGYDQRGNVYVKFFNSCYFTQFCEVTWEDEYRRQRIWIRSDDESNWLQISFPYTITCEDVPDD